MSTAIAPLLRGERRAAARVLADAFVDDPGWTAVGPAGRGRRHAYVRRICGGELLVAERCGGFVLATRDDGAVSAVLVGYPPEALPLGLLPTVAEAPGAVLAGPATLLRSLRADKALGAGHPDEPHLYVSLLAVAPRHQRGGRGRVLLTEAIRRAGAAGVPTYLDTANPANVPYYRSFGFAEAGMATLPRGAPLWYLLRAR